LGNGHGAVVPGILPAARDMARFRSMISACVATQNIRSRITMQFQRFLLAAAIAGSALTILPAAADPAQPLGDFKSWSAFTSGTGDSKVCYVLSKPRMSEPAKTKRDAIYFLINDWPGRKAKAEPEIVPGYVYKDKSTVTAEVGPNRFEFFTKNEGTSGGAWIEKQDDETKLIDAMRHGAELVVIGTSKRGTKTQDTYSLAGLSDALDKIHEACGL
jgi:hypothetical protein